MCGLEKTEAVFFKSEFTLELKYFIRSLKIQNQIKKKDTSLIPLLPPSPSFRGGVIKQLDWYIFFFVYISLSLYIDACTI